MKKGGGNKEKPVGKSFAFSHRLFLISIKHKSFLGCNKLEL